MQRDVLHTFGPYEGEPYPGVPYGLPLRRVMKLNEVERRYERIQLDSGQARLTGCEFLGKSTTCYNLTGCEFFGKSTCHTVVTMSVQLSESFAEELLNFQRTLDHILAREGNRPARLALKLVNFFYDNVERIWRPQWLLCLTLCKETLNLRDRITGSRIRWEELLLGPCRMQMDLSDFEVAVAENAPRLRVMVTTFECDSVSRLSVNMVARGLDFCGVWLPNFFWAQVYARLIE